MDELQRRLVRRIRETAKAKRIPVTHLPDLAAVSRSHFFDVMAGRKTPTLDWVSKIAEALEVDGGDLLALPKQSRSGQSPASS